MIIVLILVGRLRHNGSLGAIFVLDVGVASLLVALPRDQRHVLFRFQFVGLGRGTWLAGERQRRGLMVET